MHWFCFLLLPLLLYAEDPSDRAVISGATIEQFHLEAHFAVIPESPRRSSGCGRRRQPELPYPFRLEQDGNDWTFAPADALLDPHVTIPPGKRRIKENAKLLR